MQLKRILIATILLTVAILACANPLPLNMGTPAGPGSVETIVAATFAALTVTLPEITVTPPPSTSSLLPSSLYFLNNDSAGLKQVYRLEEDGKTVTQITFEPANVDGYDVSLVDASVAYVSNNQLLMVNADGGNRKMLVDGGVRDENNPFLTNVNSPVWSPNGQTIAYGYKGLNFYSVQTGQSNLVIENKLRDIGNGFILPDELYWPDHYSSDGSKLLITLGYYEGASAAIYYPSGNALVRLKGGEGAWICCGEPNWSPDNTSLYAANPSMGMFSPGLWKVEATTGQVTTLLAGDPGNGTFNFADEPYLAPDGQLYYFFANLPSGDYNRTPLQLVRSGPDGVTGRIPVRSETFNMMNEALWAPDASFVIVANAPIQDVYQGGIAELYYTDALKPVISLVPFAMDMKWGP
jgi:Tol biopolymer transport system component